MERSHQTALSSTFLPSTLPLTFLTNAIFGIWKMSTKKKKKKKVNQVTGTQKHAATSPGVASLLYLVSRLVCAPAVEARAIISF